MVYRDRTQAGQILSKYLSEYINKDSVVLALPNGGIPVGLEISKKLNIDFDLVFVSKITPKFNSEVGYGSVSESGITNLNKDLIAMFGIKKHEVEEDIEKTKRKISQRIKNYKLKKRININGKTVILVDDGIASGYTMINAVETVKKRNAKEIIIAVPTAPLSSYNKLLDYTDQIICPDIRDVYSFAVADAYENWYDINLESAIKFLNGYGYTAN